MDKSIILLSGGQDSVTLLLELLNKNSKRQLCALSFEYEEQKKCCISYAKKICKELSIQHKIFNCSELSELANNNIVSARNLFFISFAMLYAKNNNYNKIYIGLSKDDFDCYNDCKPEFIEKLNETLNYSFETKITILAPYINKTKFEIWEIADKLNKLNYVYENSYSCWLNSDVPCGKCKSCLIRENSYEQYKSNKINKN